MKPLAKKKPINQNHQLSVLVVNKKIAADFAPQPPGFASHGKFSFAPVRVCICVCLLMGKDIFATNAVAPVKIVHRKNYLAV